MRRRSVLLGLVGIACAVPEVGRASGATFAQGTVSLTYDDGLNSQLDRAVPALDARGLRGTFYVTWENIAARAAQWRAVADHGHELANHTMTHPCDISRLTVPRYRQQIEPLKAILNDWEPALPARDFTYPCDVTDLGHGPANAQFRRFKQLLRREGLASARTSEGLPNSLTWVRRHPYRLHALMAGYDATTLDELLGYVRLAQRERKWAILAFHDVGLGPEIGAISEDVHNRLLDALKDDSIVCERVCDVVARLRA